jgi:hypothetical protein
MSSRWAAMMLIMSSGVGSGIRRWIIKALVVIDFIERTPVR